MHQDKKEDQAASLRNQVNKNHQNHEMDSLPPRREVHQSYKKKTKWRISYPFIRLILLLFIVIVLLLLTVKFWGEEYLSSAESHESDTPAEQVFVKVNQPANRDTIKKTEEETIHEVKRIDTLFSISEEYYGSTEHIEAILDANQLEKRKLTVGEKIIIPTLEN